MKNNIQKSGWCEFSFALFIVFVTVTVLCLLGYCAKTIPIMYALYTGIGTIGTGLFTGIISLLVDIREQLKISNKIDFEEKEDDNSVHYNEYGFIDDERIN